MELQKESFRISCSAEDGYLETVSIPVDGVWTPVLESAPFATIPSDERSFAPHALKPTKAASILRSGEGLEILLEHPEHTIRRRIQPSGLRRDVLDFTVRYTAKQDVVLRAVEDRWYFLPERREEDIPLSGPLDFVWSQRIKTFPSTVISHYNFRSPIVMMQQGKLFAGLVPGLEEVGKSELLRAPLGMDLDVTRDRHPWMSFGMVVSIHMTPDKPCEAGHSQIVRGVDRKFCRVKLAPGESLEYRYSLILSRQPEKLGYRYAVRYLWERHGKPQVNQPDNMIRNIRFENAKVLEDWRKEIWDLRAEADYFTVEKDGMTAGGITGRRQGEWFSRTDYKHDVWFACWLQELVTGYGLHLYGERSKKAVWKTRTDQILNYILSAPRTGGMFPVICYFEKDGSETWLNDDGWAGYPQDFHTLQMSWTAWLMLRWAASVLPERKSEILEFCRPYAAFLQSVQHPDGCIPSWFDTEGKPSRKVFRDFNAETAVSALFLMEYGDMAGDPAALSAGERALDFITARVLPRQRWFDLETFLSCAKKPFDFYDSITAQYPQCNLSELHASIAYLVRYRITRKPEDLELAERVTDYLLLTQQLWNHPLLEIKPFGGFTVQNTDHEWSDVREGLCAILLYHYYLATGKAEYLERGVAAMRSGFEVLPYENWAHCGYEGMQYDSSLLWGGGVIMTAAEYYDLELGTLAVDADSLLGVGVDNCVVSDLSLENGVLTIAADLSRHSPGSRLSAKIFDRGRRVSKIVLNGSPVWEGSAGRIPGGIVSFSKG